MFNSPAGKKDGLEAGRFLGAAEHDWEFHRLKVDSFMDSLRDDVRFNDLLRRASLMP